MAIKYDIVLDNNLIYKQHYVCFGVLNQLRNGSLPGGTEDAQFSMRDYGVDRMGYAGAFRVEKIEFIRFNYAYTLRSENIELFKSEVHLLLNRTPCIRDIVFFDHANKFAYVRVKGQPADKVMFALTLIRNVASWVERGDAQGYLLLRRNGVDDPLKAALFATMLTVSRSVDYSRGSPRSYNYCGTDIAIRGESHIVDFQTFGKRSYERFINQDASYNPWVQGTFAENGTGYRRDTYYSSQNIVYEGFDLLSPILMLENRNVPEVNYQVLRDTYGVGFDETYKVRAYSVCRTRRMTTCHSIIGDTEPLLPQGVVWDSSIGFLSNRIPFADYSSINDEDDANQLEHAMQTGAEFERLIDFINNN